MKGIILASIAGGIIALFMNGWEGLIVAGLVGVLIAKIIEKD